MEIFSGPKHIVVKKWVKGERQRVYFTKKEFKEFQHFLKTRGFRKPRLVLKNAANQCFKIYPCIMDGTICLYWIDEEEESGPSLMYLYLTEEEVMTLKNLNKDLMQLLNKYKN